MQTLTWRKPWASQLRVIATSTSTGETFSRPAEIGRRDFSVDGLKTLLRVDPVHKIIPGPYYRKEATISHYPYIEFGIRYTWKPQPFPGHLRVVGNTVGFSMPYNRLLNSLEWHREDLINRCLVKVRDETVNLAVFMAEIKQTSSLISNTAKRLNAAYDAVENRRFTAAARILRMRKPKGLSRSKHVADNFLAYKFGWIPLVADVVGAAKHLATRAKNVNIVTVSRRTELPDRSGFTTYTSVDRTGVDHECVIRGRHDHIFTRYEQVRLTHQLDPGYWHEAQRLGLTNSGLATWEAVPYSFVVDTFLNVGEWLGNMDQGLGLTLLSAMYTQGWRYSGTFFATGEILRNGSFKDIVPYSNFDELKYQSFETRREKIFGVDALEVKLKFSSPLSVNNAINDTMLLAQRLNGRRPS